MLPAHQRFDRIDPVAGEIDLGLIVNLDLAFAQCVIKLPQQ